MPIEYHYIMNTNRSTSEEKNKMNKQIEEILESDSVHYWVKNTIRTMLTKDPIDNLKNLTILVRVAKILNGGN